MTDSDPGLVLHLPFSDALDAGPIDRSAKRHEVTVVGRPLLVADATLGAAHRFADGEYLQVSGLDLADTPAFTLTLWAKREAAEERVQLLALGAPGQGRLVLYVWPDGIPEFFVEYPDGAPSTHLFDAMLPKGDWVHLALVFDGATLRLWQDGQPLGPDVPAPGFKLQRRMLTLSSPSAAAGPSFRGSLAQLRVHDEALAGDVIRARHAADRGLRAGFVDSHPILLSLLDANDAAALYITDHPTGEPLTLEFANVAGRPVRLLPLHDETPSQHSCHFELRFRPGTLAKSAITAGGQALALAGSDNWAMSAPTTQTDGTIAFYLARHTPKAQPVTIPADARLRLELTNARADPAGGARNARVELRYGQIALGDAQTALQGSRISHLSILSHIGRHHLPLHVGFIGPNTVLPGEEVNDNRIRLRLTNISPNLPILWAPGDPDHGPASFLELSFDYQAKDEEKDWAICTLVESRNISIKATERPTLESLLLGRLVGSAQAVDTVNGVLDAWTIEPRPTKRLRDGQPVVCLTPDGRASEARIMAVAGLQADGLVFDRPPPGGDGDLVFIKTPAWEATRSSTGTAPHWKIWSDEATHLVAGDHIDLTISGIVTTLPPGPANLYLRYRNIPGYQGGELTAVIEKSNVIVRDGKMGIGVNKPEAALHIKDGDSSSLLWAGKLKLQQADGASSADASGENGPSITLRNGESGTGEIAVDENGLRLGTENASVRLEGSDRHEIGVDENGAWIGDPRERQPEQRRHALAVYGNTVQRGAVFLHETAYFARRDNGRSGPADYIQPLEYNPGTSPQANLDGKALIGERGKTGSRFLQVTGHSNGMLCVDPGGGSPYTSLVWNALGVRIPRSCTIDETLSASVKRFQIDHPTRPDAKLIHACLEGPENAVYYRGEAALEDGRAVVELPDYFEALTRKEGRTVQLTAKGTEPFLLSYEDVAGGRFSVFGAKADGRFAWEVRAVRADVEALEPEPASTATLEPAR